MAKALKGIVGQRNGAALRAWLLRIAYNESVTLLRLRTPHADLHGEAVASHLDRDGQTAARARTNELMTDLDHIPPRQRRALLMRELNGFHYDEIASSFQISEVAARQIVCEARRSLQHQVTGRATDCQTIQQSLSHNDRSVVRLAQVQAHLRDCAGCRAFQTGAAGRRAKVAGLVARSPSKAVRKRPRSKTLDRPTRVVGHV
jgi:RNA polymerase sigma factor (sigma-70 family)